MDPITSSRELRRDENLEIISMELREIRKMLQALITLLSATPRTNPATVTDAYRLDFVDGYFGAVGSSFYDDSDD